MCEECGCGNNDTREKIDVNVDIRAENDRLAQHNREHLERHDIKCLNILGSPGAGKTTLLERLIPKLDRVVVIEGDLATENDATRIRKTGAPVHQIETHGACHLDAKMVHHAMHHLDMEGAKLLLIENVGNLVCPADFYLGEEARIVVASTPEGHDKPEKYPTMFCTADLVVLAKTDLSPHLDFDIEYFRQRLREVAPNASLIELAKDDDSGIDKIVKWIDWLVSRPV